MASTKDKAVKTILLINREINEKKSEIEQYKDEIKENQEFIMYQEQIQNKTKKVYGRIQEAEETIKLLKANIRDAEEEIQDLISSREYEIAGAGFKKADFGTPEEKYTDAKLYSAWTDLSEEIRNQYPSNMIISDGKTIQARKYFALDNEEIRYASDNLYNANKETDTPEWTEKSLKVFQEQMGMTIDEWRATAKGIWATA